MINIKERFTNLNSTTFIKITGAFLFFIILILPVMAYWMYLITDTTLSPDTLIGFDIQTYYSIREIYGYFGRRLYLIQRVTFDVIWPVVYTVFLLAVIARFKKNFKLNNSLFVFPVIIVLLDFVENILASIFMFLYPKTMDALLYILMIITNLKWILLAFISIILLFELLKLTIVKLKK